MRLSEYRKSSAIYRKLNVVLANEKDSLAHTVKAAHVQILTECSYLRSFSGSR